MAERGERDEAELAYQRALAALHEARSHLADVAAARRRLSYQRVGLDPAEVAAREHTLAAEFAALTSRADQLRDEAARLREVVHRHLADAAAEPDEIPDPVASEGFEQPPFAGPAR